MLPSAHQGDANRFVVLLHQPGIASKRGAKTHYDWMFESEGQLLTWTTAPMKPGIESTQINDPIVTACEPLPPHRLAYLEYEGEVSGGRGSVTRLLAGRYTLNEFVDDLFDAELRWTQSLHSEIAASGTPETLAAQVRTARVRIYRRFFPDADGRLAESRESWLLRFSLCR
jgi:hypothetical protein